MGAEELSTAHAAAVGAGTVDGGGSSALAASSGPRPRPARGGSDRLLISPAAPAAACRRQLRREKHDMPHLFFVGRGDLADLDVSVSTRLPTRAAVTTRVMCSAVDAMSWVRAPDRGCGSRGVRGASGSR